MYPLISVIVPAYNAEKTIARTIKSIVKQTYTKLEIILINDGSTDSTKNIMMSFADADSRIVIIDKENAGVSSARNAGINIASGDYIYFLDADDYIHKTAIDILFNKIEDADMIIGGHNIIDSFGRVISCWGKNDASVKNYSYYDALKLMFDISFIKNKSNEYLYIGYSVNKLYKRSIMTKNRIIFDESIFYNEDRLFVVAYLLNCKKIKVLNKITYSYVLLETGAVGQTKNKSLEMEKRNITEIQAFDRMIHLFRIHQLDTICKFCAFDGFKRSFKLLFRYRNNNNKYTRFIKDRNIRYMKMLYDSRNNIKLRYRFLFFISRFIT